MKRRSFLQLSLALLGLPFLPKIAAKPAFVGNNAPASPFPVGSIQIHSGSVSPDGWIACNGQWLRAEDWPELAHLIGTPGKTAFQLPQMNARVVNAWQQHHAGIEDPGHSHAFPPFSSLEYIIKAK